MRTILIVAVMVVMTATTVSARVPRKTPSAFDKGTEAYDNQQYELAIRWMEEALEKFADNGFALAYKGSALRMLDRNAEAAEALERAVGLIDDVNTTFRAWAHAERFYALLELGDTVSALADLDQAIRDNDREVTYWQNRAAIHGTQFRFDQALADYDRAIALSPDDEELLQERERAVRAREYFAHRDEQCIAIEERDTVASDEVVLPQFPGGKQALNEYINALTGWDGSKKPVRVVVELLIDAQGQVTDATVVSGVNDDLDARALEICRGLPPFTPATHHGQPVGCSLSVPVRFNEN